MHLYQIYERANTKVLYLDLGAVGTGNRKRMAAPKQMNKSIDWFEKKASQRDGIM